MRTVLAQLSVVVSEVWVVSEASPPSPNSTARDSCAGASSSAVWTVVRREFPFIGITCHFLPLRLPRTSVSVTNAP